MQGLRVTGAVAVITPLHLGSGGHQPGVVAQAQVELPAEDGNVVVKPFPTGHRLLVLLNSSWPFPLIIAYSYLPPPAPTGLPSCHVDSRDSVRQEAALCVHTDWPHQSILPQHMLQGVWGQDSLEEGEGVMGESKVERIRQQQMREGGNIVFFWWVNMWKRGRGWEEWTLKIEDKKKKPKYRDKETSWKEYGEQNSGENVESRVAGE